MFTYLAHLFTDPQSLKQYLVASTVTGLTLIDSWDAKRYLEACGWLKMIYLPFRVFNLLFPAEHEHSTQKCEPYRWQIDVIISSFSHLSKWMCHVCVFPLKSINLLCLLIHSLGEKIFSMGINWSQRFPDPGCHGSTDIRILNFTPSPYLDQSSPWASIWLVTSC